LIPWTPMPSHWVKNGENYKVPTKFDEINSIGNVDTQVGTLKDLIVAYNTAELDFDVSLGEEDDEGSEGEDEDGEEGDEEEEEDE